MTSPGCTRHVVKMTTEQKYLQHLTDRATTMAALDRSLPTRDRLAGDSNKNLLRTKVTPAVEAEGHTRSNGIRSGLRKSTINSEQNSTKRTLKSVRLASPTGYGQSASLEIAQDKCTEGAMAPDTHDISYEM